VTIYRTCIEQVFGRKSLLARLGRVCARFLSLTFLSLALSSAPAWATWSLVQHVTKTNCASSTTCAVGAGDGLAATGAGHLLVGIAAQGNFDSVISSVSGGGTWALCPSSTCHINKSDAAYVLNSSSVRQASHSTSRKLSSPEQLRSSSTRLLLGPHYLAFWEPRLTLCVVPVTAYS